jgi:hypothetical protein
VHFVGEGDGEVVGTRLFLQVEQLDQVDWADQVGGWGIVEMLVPSKIGHIRIVHLEVT